MFEDITQMEKEIETFRNNIIASSELVEGIANLTEAAKSQKDSLDNSTRSLINKLDECIRQFKADHDESLQTLSSNNSAEIEKLQQTIAADMQKWISGIEVIKEAIKSNEETTIKKNDEQIQSFVSATERIIEDMKSTISALQDGYISSLKQAENAINTYQNDAENKYNSFVQRMESTNVDQIFKEVRDLKKSMHTKFIIEMVGIGGAAAAAILSIIIK